MSEFDKDLKSVQAFSAVFNILLVLAGIVIVGVVWWMVFMWKP